MVPDSLKKSTVKAHKLILNATYRHAVGTVVAVHIGTATVEVQVAGIGATYRTTPVVAVTTDIVERTIVVAVATNWKNKNIYLYLPN